MQATPIVWDMGTLGSIRAAANTHSPRYKVPKTRKVLADIGNVIGLTRVTSMRETLGMGRTSSMREQLGL